MKFIFLIIIVYVFFAGINVSGQTQHRRKTLHTIGGTVTDLNNNPLPYVNVYILNSYDGAMTNDRGKFRFKTSISGNAIIIASLLGYKKFERTVNIAGLKKHPLNIHLKNQAVKTKEVIVTASTFGSEKGKGIVMTPMEVYMTPGGAADIFQTLKTLPGLTQVSESAELYVRGGSPEETLIMVNQAPVKHPYTYESAYGGIFSSINTSAVKSMFFSSGGFSAKYGNTMSGVLDLETKNEPEINQLSVGISMANLAITGSRRIINDKLGVRLSYRRSFTKPIFLLNGSSRQFTIIPNSSDYYGSVIYKVSNSGRLKFFTSGEQDRQGINLLLPGYVDQFKGQSESNFYNLQYSDAYFSDIVLKSTLYYTKFKDIWNLGVLDLSQTDKVYGARTDINFLINSVNTLSGGVEYEKRKTVYLGRIPEYSYNLRSNAPGSYIDASPGFRRYGGYLEYEGTDLLGIKGFFLRAGGRADIIESLNLRWFDPRLSLGYKLSDRSTLSFSSGIFHEVPDPRYFAPVDGNPALKSMHAVHYIISYDYKINDENNFRIEGYYKKYYDLPLDDNKINYSNNGRGYAKGVDVMFKTALSEGFSGWISYGYINTKRKWLDAPSLLPSDYDITNNLAVVLKYNLLKDLQAGINYKYATGKPYTPVTGSIFQRDQHVYEPVYELKNSARLPDYQRLDFRLTYLTSIFSRFTVLYIEALNILNIDNIFDYSYNFNYSAKLKVKSYFGRRTIVIGAQINL